MLKRMMVWVLMIMFFPCIVLSETVPPFELKTGIVFGTTMKEVQDESFQDFHKGSSTELICNTTICGVDASMALTFGKKTGLYEIICQFDTKGLKAKYCISDYENVSSKLVERYGEAAISGNRWTSKEVYEQYGDDVVSALEKRKTVFVECWNFTDVYIVHMMAKTKSEGIQHFLDYYSPLLHPDIDKLRETYGY